MAIIEIVSDGSYSKFDGTIAQTPQSGSDLVGAYVEVIETPHSMIDLYAVDAAYGGTISNHLDSQGYVHRDGSTLIQQDDDVRSRRDNGLPFFGYDFYATDAETEWLLDWIELMVEDEPVVESGWSNTQSTGSLVHIEATLQEAERICMSQDVMERRGGDTDSILYVSYVLDAVEAPISLRSNMVHQDMSHALYRPGSIFQATFPDIEPERGEQYDRVTHFAQASVTKE